MNNTARSLARSTNHTETMTNHIDIITNDHGLRVMRADAEIRVKNVQSEVTHLRMAVVTVMMTVVVKRNESIVGIAEKDPAVNEEEDRGHEITLGIENWKDAERKRSSAVLKRPKSKRRKPNVMIAQYS